MDNFHKRGKKRGLPSGSRMPANADQEGNLGTGHQMEYGGTNEARKGQETKRSVGGVNLQEGEKEFGDGF